MTLEERYEAYIKLKIKTTYYADRKYYKNLLKEFKKNGYMFHMQSETL